MVEKTNGVLPADIDTSPLVFYKYHEELGHRVIQIFSRVEHGIVWDTEALLGHFPPTDVVLKRGFCTKCHAYGPEHY